MTPLTFSLIERKAKEKCLDKVFQEKAFVAFKVGLAVSIGTLLSITPGYAALWNNPVSLADQVIFTILGGANLTVGGMTTQLVYRLVLGAATGSLVFMGLFSLGHWPIAQGIIFFVVVFVLTYARFKIFKMDTGLQFATLAAVYAVDYSYRAGNIRGMDWDGLADLMRAWAFGGAISVAVNVLVLPVKASRLSRDRTVDTLLSMTGMIAWLIPCGNSNAPISETPSSLSPIAVRRGLYNQIDTLTRLQDELSWEIGYTSSNLSQREEILRAVDEVHKRIVSGSRGGSFADLSEDLKVILEPSVRLFSEWSERTLNSTAAVLSCRAHSRVDVESPTGDRDEGIRMELELENARKSVTDLVVKVWRKHGPIERMEALDRATHCLDTMGRLRISINHLEKLIIAQSQRPKKIQPYILTTLSRSISSFRPSATFPTASAPARKASEASQTTSASSLIVPPSFGRRLLPHLTSPASQYALKVPLALSCLLALLWSPSTRQFFLSYAVRNSTVPLLLALMPTLGLSVLSWVGQLSGAVVGALWAAMTMRIFQGVGPRAYSAPGIFFFEWILCLAVGHRMREGPDFFAVTAMNACAIFINVQWQLTGTPGQATLPLRLAYMLTTASIAIALAIPFQLLIFPQHARTQLRSGIARILRRMAHIAIDEVELSGMALFTSDAETIQVESERLKGEVRGIKDDLRAQDGLQFLASHEWGLHGRFQAERGCALLDTLHCCIDTMSDHITLAGEGPTDVRVRFLLKTGNEGSVRTFAEACSLTFWSLGASWELSEDAPNVLPSVCAAGADIMRFFQYPDEEDADSAWLKDPRVHRDVGRLWSLTLTLVTQRASVDELTRILGPSWDRERREQWDRPETTRQLTGSSVRKSEIKGEGDEEAGGDSSVLPVIR